jgi:hypothetical protein
VTKRDPNVTRRLLRLKPAAEYLSVSTRAVRSLVQQGELPIVSLSENDHAPWLVDVRDLDSLVERKKKMVL